MNIPILSVWFSVALQIFLVIMEIVLSPKQDSAAFAWLLLRALAGVLTCVLALLLSTLQSATSGGGVRVGLGLSWAGIQALWLGFVLVVAWSEYPRELGSLATLLVLGGWQVVAFALSGVSWQESSPDVVSPSADPLLKGDP